MFDFDSQFDTTLPWHVDSDIQFQMELIDAFAVNYDSAE